MTKSNRYFKRSRFSDAQTRLLIRYFSLDLTAVQIADLMDVSRNTINKYLRVLREIIAEHCDAADTVRGIIEVDESWFGARRVKGKRGRGAYGKTVVFGIFKRNGRVYTEIVSDASKVTLQKVIRGRVDIESVIHTDGWRGYNGLVDIGYDKHLRVDHSKNEFANRHSHINGIEGFWGYAKTRLVKYKGMNKNTFYLHLKECEFRFNNRKDNIYKILLKLVRNHRDK